MPATSLCTMNGTQLHLALMVPHNLSIPNFTHVGAKTVAAERTMLAGSLLGLLLGLVLLPLLLLLLMPPGR